ncbi:cobyric acid synthase CobQ [Alkaliphilus metalliredigens QYMF]|uniref:Cobyric acid synthase n=2 Tax=Alkaliphilus TaxID=114627 RepID=COBQ_ALKMQ|nr:RecName: Full=Cobyric acid synthase [Alkaliphilus metalliredigens QYMF]ABR49738.1 cobyric acid synthase CobQ [Alkaliphilus metalliredigens QYMF]
MVQGTASSVGKSLLTAALCRIFNEDGYRVVPFKSQNMALNSFVTEEGLEMGRAQVFQAEAARIKPQVKMNPILLKPTADSHAQVIIQGAVHGNMTAQEYHQFKPQLKSMLRDIYLDLETSNDIVVIEGAGSPAEINLRDQDIVNMGMAEIADSPVILVGDIDRGGVFASLYGTIMLLEESERSRVKGILINKFRGDLKILEPGLKMLEELINIPVIGVIPYERFDIEDEDSLSDRLQQKNHQESDISIAIIRLPHISNFTDFHLLEQMEGVNVNYIGRNQSIGRPDMIIIPGSKNTIGDLKYLQEVGLAAEIIEVHKTGTMICGICGGYQMLGNRILDPNHVESPEGEIQGLGLLDVETNFESEKVTTQVSGKILDHKLLEEIECGGIEVKGYEIHMGRTLRGATIKPFVKIEERLSKPVDDFDGAINEAGTVFGTYLHGIFDEISLVEKIINGLLMKKGLPTIQQRNCSLEELKDREYSRLAKVVRENIDMKYIYKILEGEA